MAEQLTTQQKQAITDRGGKLLVSAAAGSGKTKVLVDRLLSYLLDPVQPANLDEFLIITYTKAAASELRGKIAAKLNEKIAEQPENRHLQQQLQRLHLTKISTVHSFCSDILREYAYILDIPADFRVADEDESLELQSRVLQTLLEEAYSQIHTDPDLCAFVDTQGFGRDDRRIPEIILKVYQSAFCHLDPMGWLAWCGSVYSGDCTDASETIWGRYLMDDLFRYLDLQISALDTCMQCAMQAEAMEKPAQLLAETLDQLRTLRSCKLWNEICDHRHIDYGRLVFSKNVTDVALADQIKAIREACKSGLEKKLSKFTDKSDAVLSDYANSMRAARGLIALVIRFIDGYRKQKQIRRILDFTDLEHRTLDLLIGKSRSGSTNIAREVGQRFREVMVDEYQDSNEVQDAIFSALTESKQNCFMVGDVKQSIYQFRMADPSIFIDKYNRFVPADSAIAGQGRKVVLSSNFRSCGSVIKAVNDVFSTCMSPEIGGLYYTSEEALNEGIPHIASTEAEIELYGVEVESDTYAEEAAFVAQRISQLLDGTHMVRQGDVFRPITPEDIVIILRSPGSVGYEYQYALERRGIRCAAGTGDDLLETEEVQTLLSLLQTINNPIQDIPLVATLTSRIFCFTADDLARLRAGHKGGSVYSALKASDSEKAKHFLKMLALLRKFAQMESISKLLMQIFSVTRIDSIFAALPDGSVRVENLQSFCQIATAFQTNTADDLSRFLEHINHAIQRGLPAQSGMSSKGAVTIMSIHKSKGLEFPVVFLCGLARQFNQESLRAQVLCDKELGLGLSCVDSFNRIQYPSISKNAIAAKMKMEAISEELRVLYVAMTRAKDRLIMTYSSQRVRKEVEELAKRMALSQRLLLTSTADCPGRWILMTAIACQNGGWSISYVKAPEVVSEAVTDVREAERMSVDTVRRIGNGISFSYPYAAATKTPSKQTATQLKGREKDSEAAENTNGAIHYRNWRKPRFVDGGVSAVDRGNTMHAVMQYIRFENCDCVDNVRGEISRLVEQGYISKERASSVNADQIAAFFTTNIGKELRQSKHVLREFKFSILVEPEQVSVDAQDKILLQGVVDCALITDDGIYIIDFKTDRVTMETLDLTVDKYRGQLEVYAKALSRIYSKPVKSAQLYFFCLSQFFQVL